MKENVARRPRFRRVPDLGPFLLTERDKAILSAVSRYRFLTTSHILSLVSGSRQNVVRRLQRLYHAGFLDRPKAQLTLRVESGLSEFVYSLTRKGGSHITEARWRANEGRGYKTVSSLFLAHALLVSDSLISIERTCRAQGANFFHECEILDTTKHEEETTRIQWRIGLKSDGRPETVGVVPDAAFAIERRDGAGQMRRFHFFLEADRGTMPLIRKSLCLSSIRRKALAYLRSSRRRVLQERFGIVGFQVLFVGKSKARLDGIKRSCDAVNGSDKPSLFLYTTVAALDSRHLP